MIGVRGVGANEGDFFLGVNPGSVCLRTRKKKVWCGFPEFQGEIGVRPLKGPYVWCNVLISSGEVIYTCGITTLKLALR